MFLGGIGACAEVDPGHGVEFVREVAHGLGGEHFGGAGDDDGLFEAVGEVLRRAGPGDAVAAGPEGDGDLAGVDAGAVDVLAGEGSLGAAGGVGPFE